MNKFGVVGNCSFAKSILILLIVLMFSISAYNEGQHYLRLSSLPVSSSLNLPRIDSVIVTPPDVSDDATLESLEPLWIALEDAVGRGEVVSIGLADVSYQLFRELYSWAKVRSAVQFRMH